MYFLLTFKITSYSAVLITSINLGIVICQDVCNNCSVLLKYLISDQVAGTANIVICSL